MQFKFPTPTKTLESLEPGGSCFGPKKHEAMHVHHTSAVLAHPHCVCD